MKNKKALEDFQKRRSMRGATQGRALEDMVRKVLEAMRERGELVRAVYHSPNSSDDRDGRDFTVTKRVDGKEISRSFGVTISQRRWTQSRRLHPDIPQFWFPLSIKPETICRKVSALFAETRKS